MPRSKAASFRPAPGWKENFLEHINQKLLREGQVSPFNERSGSKSLVIINVTIYNL